MTAIPLRLRPCLPWIPIAAVLAAAGCTAVGSQWAELPDDVTAARSERKEKVVDDFERARDAALYQAALARWRDGDAAACESLLVRLLRRNERHREARLMLADLYASTGKPQAAEQHLRRLLERNADDAQAQHALGMLLATTGRPAEALPYLEKAAQLEPDNELYALSYGAAQADVHRPDLRSD